MFQEESQPIYSINAVSKMTNISAATLRYWESRFGLIQPLRTDGGHRLFSSQDIERIKWIKSKMDDDHLRAREAHMMLAQKLAQEGKLNEPLDIRHAIMILIAEKDPITAELEQYFLEEAGYEVLLVFDGKKAVSEAEKKQPDLIIIDVILPGVSGLKVCKAIKKNDRTSHIPILVFSILDVRDRALGAGADAFLLKPIDQPQMIEIVKNLLVNQMPKGGSTNDQAEDRKRQS
ncbi:MAG: response regulator [Actinobacteria bacterium]|nr:response regulator [Actinomycetota bacterium]MCL5883734.1 response regulator [Actinomycetota bacterium]